MNRIEMSYVTGWSFLMSAVRDELRGRLRLPAVLCCLIASTVCSVAQFDIISNGAPSQAAGTLFVDLRVDTFGGSTWTNFGTLANFNAVGAPSLATNVAGTSATLAEHAVSSGR